MPILAALSALKPFASAAWSFATSRLGQIILAAAVAYGLGHHRASHACAAREAAQRAALERAHQVELAREAEAASEIAAAATQRLEDDAAAASAQQQIIDRLESEPAHVAKLSQNIDRGHAVAPAAPSRPCVVDGALARRVRDFDAAGRGARAPAGAAR